MCTSWTLLLVHEQCWQLLGHAPIPCPLLWGHILSVSIVQTVLNIYSGCKGDRFYSSICSGYPQVPYPWYPQAGNVPPPQAPFMSPPQTPPPQQAPQPAQEPQPQANENVQANANAGPLFDDDEDEDNANRDWLDKIYTLCRIGILLSIFWFYSSTSRFVVLIITFVLIYLYQAGIFHIFRRNRGKCLIFFVDTHFFLQCPSLLHIPIQC